MAIDLASAKQYYQSFGAGAQPPQGMPFDDWVVQWFTNAVNAGVPSAVQAAGGKKQEDIEAGWEDPGDYQLPWQDAADPSEWLGKRAPTPAELRKLANTSGWSENFNRYGDRQVAAWIKDKWSVADNRFKNDWGDLVEKPTDAGPNTPPGMTGLKDGGSGGTSGGGSKASTEPTTEGTAGEISYTGNPLTDMLIAQFNSQRNLADPTKSNLFGWLAGRNPQDPTKPPTATTAPFQDVTGRLLSGGGLWWAPSTEWKNVTSTGESDRAPAAPPAAAPAAPTPQPTLPVTTGSQNPTPRQIPSPTLPPMPAGPYAPTTSSPLQDMLTGKRKKGYFDLSSQQQYFS